MTDRPNQPAPALTPPDDETTRKDGSVRKLTVLSVVLGLFVLLIMLIGVLWVLPKLRPPDSAPPLAEFPITKPVDDISRGGEQEKAQDLLQAWLTLRVRAESDTIVLWGGDEYSRVLNTAEAANEALQRNDFGEAGQRYGSAITQLKTLLAQKGAILETSLKNGTAALLENQPLIAADAFERALAIDPENSEARKGARRAAVRDEVNALMAESLKQEEAGELPAALDLLTELLKLDEEYVPAQEAKDRITAKREEERFQEAMTTFLSSLERRDLTSARRAYEQARALRGDDRAVEYAGQRLAAAEEADRLQALRRKAEQQVDRELWSDAVMTYNTALKISPQALFAVNGQREAKKRAELDAVLVSILTRPERLQEDGPLKEAKQTLEYAMNIADPGPRLQGQIDRLSNLLDAARTPVTINLTSDNETDVVIYHVGRLGRFLHKSLTVRPGTYTIVGTREGYRDIRITMSIEPGKEAVNILIACEELI